MFSRVWRLSVVAFSLVLIGSSAVRAQPAAPALPVAQFVDETTVLVADVNISAVDLDAAVGWARALLKQGGLPDNDLTDFDKHSAEGLAHVKKWQEGFVKAGGSHMYLVVSVNQEAPVFVVFPVGAAGADALKQSFSEQGGLPPDMTRGSSMEVVGNMLVMSSAAGVKAAKEIAGNPQRTPRPDLAAAFAAAGNAPHRLAFAPSEQLKGGLIIQQPKLPAELGGGATAPVVNAFKFAYIALQSPTAASPKINARIVVQAKDANGAQTLKNIADTGMKMLRGQADHIGVPIPPAMFDQLSPQVAGDQLVVELDQAKFENSAKSLVTAIGTAQGHAKQVASMSNMRQILNASIMYSVENKDAAPTRVPEDIATYLGVANNAPQLKTIFTNPVNGRYPGYVYVKPAEKLSLVKNPSLRIVLYEAYDQWPAEGINVGFADGHVQTVKSEADFKTMLNNK